MSAWLKIAEGACWDHWADLKQTFGTADKVGNCVVFDIGNNLYRVIGRVFFDKDRLYILAVMDHEEYDKKDSKGKPGWIAKCGCHRPPPRPDPSATKRPPGPTKRTDARKLDRKD